MYDDSQDFTAITHLVKQLRLFGSLTVMNLGDPSEVTQVRLFFRLLET